MRDTSTPKHDEKQKKSGEKKEHLRTDDRRMREMSKKRGPNVTKTRN
jgi:hypothetical protein